jgi:hypothetical protein
MTRSSVDPNAAARAEQPRQDADGGIHAALGAVFQNDDAVRGALADNLRARGIASLELRARAQSAFSDFDPSRHSSERRAQPDYVAPGGDVTSAQTDLINKGLDLRRQNSAPRGVRLVTSDAFNGLIEKPDARRARTVKLGPFMSYLDARLSGSAYAATDSALTDCKAEEDAKRRLAAILAEGDAAKKLPAAAAKASGHIDPAKPDAGIAALSTTKLVQRLVDLQVQTMNAPESELAYAVPSESEQTADSHTKPTFELRLGPTDVVAFHDFYSLQIAFQSVWMELVDERLSTLGQQLYQEYVQLKNFTGIDDGRDPTIASMGDLKNLMDEIRDFSRLTTKSIPGELNPAGKATGPNGQAGTDIGTTVVNTIIDATLPGVRQLVDWLAGTKFAVEWNVLDSKTTLPTGDTIGYKVVACPPSLVEIVLSAPAAHEAREKTIVFTNPALLGNYQMGASVLRDGSANDGSKAITLPSAFVPGGTLEFQRHDGFNFRGVYVLTGLQPTLADGKRLIFTWKDAAGVR